MTRAFERVVVNSSAGLNYPTGMTIHPERGTLLVANFGGNNVMEFDLNTGQKLSEFGGGQLLAPMAVHVHPTRHTLLVSGRDNRSILEYRASDGAYLGTFASSPLIESAFNFNFDLNTRSIYLANYRFGGGSLVRFDLDSGAFISNFTGLVIEPSDALINPLTGNVLVDSNHEVLELNPITGALVRRMTTPGLSYPTDLAWSKETNDLLVISRGFSQSIYKFDGATGAAEGVLIPHNTGGMTGPQGMMIIPEPGLCFVSLGMFRVFSLRSRRHTV